MSLKFTIEITNVFLTQLCKKKLGMSPFQIPDTCSKAYKEKCSELRIDMNRTLDPSGKIENSHRFN